MDAENNGRIDQIPLRELSISRSLRRDLQKAGARTLAEAFALDNRAIFANLSVQSDRELEGYQRTFKKDPERLRRELLQPKTEQIARGAASYSSASGNTQELSEGQTDPIRVSDVSRAFREAGGAGASLGNRSSRYVGPAPFFGKPMDRAIASSPTLPRQPFSEPLLRFQHEASGELKRLSDHAFEAIVAEAFPAFDLSIDEYRLHWQDFFSFYFKRDALGKALDLVESVLPDAFVIVVADAARRLHEGGTVLEHIYEEFSIVGQSNQVRFKNLFVGIVRGYGMQTYSADESSRYYQHTILLHAGLSGEAWRSLWDDTLIPLAQQDDMRQAYDGLDVLRRALERDGSFQVKNIGVRNMLAKAPAAAIAPLLEASLKAARQYERFDKSSTDVALISSEGLSGEAMQAYLQVVQRRQEAREHRGNTGQNRPAQARRSTRAFYWINDPLLSLDLRREAKPVCVKLQGQRLSSDFVCCSFEVYLNGELLATEPVRQSVHGCILEPISVWVDPAEQFVVEIKVIEGAARNKRREIASRITYFVDAREGVFEFQGRPGDEVLRYREGSRQRGSIIRKAILVSPGYSVRLGRTVDPVPAVKLDGMFSVVAYDAPPGGAATILAPDGRQVAWIQERFSTIVERSWLMGSLGGRDLYGLSRVASGDGYNDYLPTIEVIAPESKDARPELDITCMCDGRQCHPDVRNMGLRYQGDLSSNETLVGSRVVIDLALTYMPSLIEDGRLEVRHRLTGETILDYRFAVLPLRGLRLDAIGWGGDSYLGRYSFECCRMMRVSAHEGDAVEVSAGSRASFSAPLGDEVATLRIACNSEEDDGVLSPSLLLAGMSVELPECWNNPSRSISLDDVSTEDGVVHMDVRGNRSGDAVSRGYFLMCGGPISYIPNVDSTSHYDVDVFLPLLEGATVHSPLGQAPDIEALLLMVTYGWPERAGEEVNACMVTLGQLRKTFDNRLRVVKDEEGERYLDFGMVPRSDLYYRFSETEEGTPIGEDNMRIGIPPHDRRRKRADGIRLQLAACGPLDFEPNWKLVQIIRIEEDA